MNVDYDNLAIEYLNYRAPDPRIGAAIWKHIPAGGTVLNVGAGQGSYEPNDCAVIAIEPSQEMIARRSSTKAPAVQGIAEHLPFDVDCFDTSLAILTIHHWQDLRQGLSELKRVTRGKIVILTWNGVIGDFWLPEYLPCIERIDKDLFPPIDELCNILGAHTEVEPIDIPHDCSDGFMGAYWRRPEMYLNASARQAISTFSRVGDVKNGLDHLRDDLDSGRWHRKHKSLMQKTTLDCGYRLVVHDNSIAQFIDTQN